MFTAELLKKILHLYVWLASHVLLHCVILSLDQRLCNVQETKRETHPVR